MAKIIRIMDQSFALGLCPARTRNGVPAALACCRCLPDGPNGEKSRLTSLWRSILGSLKNYVMRCRKQLCKLGTLQEQCLEGDLSRQRALRGMCELRVGSCLGL